MSAEIKRLVRLGYVVQKPHPSDARRLQLFLSSKGTAAMRATSVLDADRVQGVLDALKGSERRRALDGLALFAKAARAMMEG